MDARSPAYWYNMTYQRVVAKKVYNNNYSLFLLCFNMLCCVMLYTVFTNEIGWQSSFEVL